MTTTRPELIAMLAQRAGTSPLTNDEIDACLSLAGAAAHGTGDRTSAPLAVFLAGLAAANAESRLSVLEAMREHIEGSPQ
jgi:uncharacterized OsmC-like protein